MTVDRSRGVDRHALSPTANRIKKDEIRPGGLDTLTPESDGRSDIAASPGNTPAGLCFTLRVCVCVCEDMTICPAVRAYFTRRTPP